MLASKLQEKNILFQDFLKINYSKFRKKYFVIKKQKIKCFKQSGGKFWVKTIAPFKLNQERIQGGGGGHQQFFAPRTARCHYFKCAP